MVRDKDLRKWGRLSAALMIILGLFLIVAAIYSINLVHTRLEPAMRSARGAEEQMIKRIADRKLSEAFHASLEYNRKIDQHLLNIARAFILSGGIGASLLSFYTAALSWRSYELALATQKPQTSNDQDAQES